MTGEPCMAECAHGLPMIEAAVAYAQRLHAGQLRQVDGAPFILHPLEVASLLYQAGAPDHVIAAGVLHDTLEKTDTAAGELVKRFGARVASLVCAVTEDEGITEYARRKAALRDQVSRAGREALMVFAADKFSKVRELRLGATVLGPTRSRRINYYRSCLRMLREQLSDFPLVSALQTELEALQETAGAVPVGVG